MFPMKKRLLYIKKGQVVLSKSDWSLDVHGCSVADLVPRKLTCAMSLLKINGWFRCISYWNSPFFGGSMLVFRGEIYHKNNWETIHPWYIRWAGRLNHPPLRLPTLQAPQYSKDWGPTKLRRTAAGWWTDHPTNVCKSSFIPYPP